MGTVVTYTRTQALLRPHLGLMRRCSSRRLLRLYQSQHHRQRAGNLAARIHLPLRLSRLRHPRSVAGTSWAELLRSMLNRSSRSLRSGAWLCCRHRRHDAALSLFPGAWCRSPSACLSCSMAISPPAERRNLHYGEVGLEERRAGHQRSQWLHAGRHRHRTDDRGCPRRRQRAGAKGRGRQCSL